MQKGRDRDSSTVEPGDPTPDADPDRPSFRVGAHVPSSRTTGRYERGKEIARGGLGRVTNALDRTLQREVAIKELHERTEQGMRRFVREGLTTARLQHPAIVPVLDAGTWEGGDPFLVMKLLAGKTLAEELAARTTTASRLALLPNLLAVADALGYAHEQGVVHRDVKPANIMVGTHGETVLLDWGVAHDSSAMALETEGKGRGPEPVALSPDSNEPLTVAGSLAGTVRYMSPEQARGEPPVPGFDVYSLGITIASVLGGRVPFDGDSQQQVVEVLRTGRTSVPQLPAEIAPDLAAIVAKATAPVAERYAHAGQLADDLRKFIAGQLVSARRYTRGELFARWLRRNRWFVAIGAAAVGLVAIVTIIAVRSVVDERNIAVTQREASEARARDLVLLQARASLRADPTATIAWLKQYPIEAPHQDEVLAMVDEATGRGVARHVWRGSSSPADAVFEGRSLVVANRDGTIVRADLATGARRPLGAVGKPLLYVRATPQAVFALDQDGGLHRVVGDGPLEHRQTIVISSHVNAFYFLPATNELKVVFPDDEATLIPALTMDPATLTILPKRFDNYTYTDDVNDARIWFIVQPSGELFLVEPPAARKLWAFAPGTWVRSSADGRAYAAIVPGPKGRGMGDGVSVWLALVGADPVQVGSMRACLPGDDRDEVAEISADARVAVVKRCGAMAVFTRGHEPREITSAERVGVFHLSRDGRWLVVSRSGAVELLDLVSGATRELAGGSTVALADVSPDHAWVFSSGGDHGTRVWPLATDSAVGILGELAAPARIVIPETGQLAILRHLECSHWSTSERAITQRFGATPVQARDLDSEEQLWPQAISADGHACVFAGQNGVAIVATDDGATHVLPGKPELLTCVLAPDGKRATCETKAGLVAFDVATGVRGAARATPEDAKLRGLVMYRGAPVALVSRATGCTLESPDGTVIAKLAGGGDCRQLRTSGATHPGDETALLVDRPAGVEVWTADGELSVPSESGVVDVSAKGLVAVARDQAIEIWDRRLHARRGGPALHGHAVELLAWSPLEILAAVDDETVRLWDPAADVTRVIYAPHTIALAWSRDGKSLFTTDGHTIATWPVEVRRGATPQEVRARLDALTSAEIVDGRVATP